MIIDGLIQYACAVDRKEIHGKGDIAFEGLGKQSEVPVGLLANLGRAKGRNYYLDLSWVSSFINHSVAIFLTKIQDVGEC